MVEAEKRPRASLEAGETGPATEQARLTAPARALDRCGDLLRRRRAKAEFGGNPDEARPAPPARSRATSPERPPRAAWPPPVTRPPRAPPAPCGGAVARRAVRARAAALRSAPRGRAPRHPRRRPPPMRVVTGAAPSRSRASAKGLGPAFRTPCSCHRAPGPPAAPACRPARGPGPRRPRPVAELSAPRGGGRAPGPPRSPGATATARRRGLASRR
ncbi:DUF2630 family protein [Streptomyces diastaticus]|uniref:DUF2630 family protein n=1 Tax=Streptomyces diastaticus TaxID=1956 RepID=UPI0038148197